MKTVTVYYETARGRKMEWTFPIHMLEGILDRCEFKGFTVLDWVYNE